jgi:hypothetical protein
LIIFPQSTVQTVLKAYVGEFHNSPQVNFFSHETSTNPVRRLEKGLSFFGVGRKEELHFSQRKDLPLFSGFKGLQESGSNHSENPFRA